MMLKRLLQRNTDPQLKARMRAFDEAAAPILSELRSAGVKVRSGDDLVDLSHEPLPSHEVIEILRRWLPRVDNPVVKTTLAQALTERRAGAETARVALTEFRQLSAEGSDERVAKEKLASCVQATATPELLDDIISVAHDPRHGETRSILVETLGDIGGPQAVAAAIDFLDDREVRSTAIYVLGKLKDERARPHLQDLLKDPDFGQAASIALSKLPYATY